MDGSSLTPTQRRDMFLGGVVRRLVLLTVVMGVLFAVTTTLDAIWPPLAWIVPLVATVTLVVLVAAALTGRWPRRAGTPPPD